MKPHVQSVSDFLTHEIAEKDIKELEFFKWFQKESWAHVQAAR